MGKLRTILIPLFIAIILISYSFSLQALFFMDLGERVLRMGMEGTDVALLQQLLAQKGFYKSDAIDGIFGKMTENAVREFQRSKNLKVDGIVGPETFSALPKDSGVSASRAEFNRDEILLLARVIHGEARGESFSGQVAVGAVVLNRVGDPRFPDSIRDVVMQDGQFCILFDGQINLYPGEKSLEAARAALLGYDPSRGALFFYNPAIAANSSWVSQRPVSVRIGNHVFTR